MNGQPFTAHIRTLNLFMWLMRRQWGKHGIINPRQLYIPTLWTWTLSSVDSAAAICDPFWTMPITAVQNRLKCHDFSRFFRENSVSLYILVHVNTHSRGALIGSKHDFLPPHPFKGFACMIGTYTFLMALRQTFLVSYIHNISFF